MAPISLATNDLTASLQNSSLQDPEDYKPLTAMDKINAQLQSPFFNKLPPEIRHAIYTYALTGTEPRQPLTPAREWLTLGLLSTCRRIYLETYRLPISINYHHIFDNHSLFLLDKLDGLSRMSTLQRQDVSMVHIHGPSDLLSGSQVNLSTPNRHLSNPPKNPSTSNEIMMNFTPETRFDGNSWQALCLLTSLKPRIKNLAISMDSILSYVDRSITPARFCICLDLEKRGISNRFTQLIRHGIHNKKRGAGNNLASVEKGSFADLLSSFENLEYLEVNIDITRYLRTQWTRRYPAPLDSAFYPMCDWEFRVGSGVGAKVLRAEKEAVETRKVVRVVVDHGLRTDHEASDGDYETDASARTVRGIGDQEADPVGTRTIKSICWRAS